MTEPIHRNSLKPGHRLHWYSIEKILGQGGFGITYLAHDFNLNQEVAIKEYLPMELAVREQDFSVQPASDTHGELFKWGLDRFMTEAQTLARFKHPNIVRVLAVFQANRTGYMVMEYEEGDSLKDLLARRPDAGRGGLEKVHERGFIHRDIKPANHPRGWLARFDRLWFRPPGLGRRDPRLDDISLARLCAVRAVLQ